MRKVLIVASVASMIKQFNMRNINLLIENNVEVTVATNFDNPGTITEQMSHNLINELENMGVKVLQIDFIRGVGSIFKNFEILKQLRKISKYDYDIVHVHSPIASVLVRLAFKKSDSKIIYTAHGFHFFKGSSILNWILFYPLEKYLSKYTDLILTINNEDTIVAENFNTCKVKKLPGVGIDYEKFSTPIDNNESKKLKENLSISDGEYTFISIGEISDRKNHISAIRALKKVKYKYKYIICGTGPLQSKLEKEIKKLHLEDNVLFLGYSENISQILAVSDLSLFLSKREGLGLAGLEAMASGVPLISSYRNGIKDYTKNEETGFVVNDPENVEQISSAIISWINLPDENKRKMRTTCKTIAKNYDKKNVDEIMKRVYEL